MALKRSKVVDYCECRWLERKAVEPGVPVEFDDEFNEYHMVSERARSVLRFCPFCGLKAPQSKRSSKFAEMTNAELDRVQELTKDIRTLEDAIRILGQPDSESDSGGRTVSQSAEDEPSRAVFYDRTLYYRSLSETVDICVQVSRHGPIQLSFSGKYLGRERGGGSA